MSAIIERTAAEVLVDGLAAQGIAHCFGVPGESYLAVLDALHDRGVAFTTCRQEGGAAMMAEAVGRATGRPVVCFVTRGPGGTNASAGLHVEPYSTIGGVAFSAARTAAARPSRRWIPSPPSRASRSGPPRSTPLAACPR